MNEWKLVPVEPTPEMQIAGLEHGGIGCALAYADMLAAAPEPPPTRDAVAEVEMWRAQNERLLDTIERQELALGDMSAEIARLKAENERLNALIDGSYVRNCIIKPKPGDGLLFGCPTATVRLDGYAIIPIEEYKAIRGESGDE